MRQIVFDLETTGLRFEDGHRIVEIGAVELFKGAVSGRTFHTYVNPLRNVPDEAARVHGLTEDFLRGYPPFADARVGRAFVEFVGDAQLIAHNGIAFDLPFVNAELAGAGLPTFSNDNIIDTLVIARRRFPGASASLDALCARFGVDTRQRERDGHGALLDSRLLAAVYIELTGGSQAGLDFESTIRGQTASIGVIAAAARRRPFPLAPLLSDAEAAAHAAFVARDLAQGSFWRTRLEESGV
jgi:DNA polymerase-3 subunit epsilon